MNIVYIIALLFFEHTNAVVIYTEYTYGKCDNTQTNQIIKSAILCTIIV